MCLSPFIFLKRVRTHLSCTPIRHTSNPIAPQKSLRTYVCVTAHLPVCISTWSLAKVFYDRAKVRDRSMRLDCRILSPVCSAVHEMRVSHYLCVSPLLYFHQLMQATCNAPRCTDFATPRRQIFVDTTNLIWRECIYVVHMHITLLWCESTHMNSCCVMKLRITSRRANIFRESQRIFFFLFSAQMRLRAKHVGKIIF